METRTCQNCKEKFVVEREDFNFYEHIKVPPPTFCPECRRQRRFAWRNERTLYKINCNLCKKSTISMYPTDSIFPVYCISCWYSDNWDPLSYGIDYDFSKTFFEQFGELINKVPHMAIFQRNTLNSQYSNMVGESKNVYLSISTVLGSENVFYSWGVDKSFNIYDCHNVKESDNLYENIECEKNYNSQHMLLSRNCIDSYFLIDCVSCNNCILSHNLRNKEFYIRNKQYTKEEYFNELRKMNLNIRSSRKKYLEEYEKIKLETIYKYANITRSVDSSGNNLTNVKNCKNCFNIHDMENSKNVFRAFYHKDTFDVDYAGKSELMYEYITGALNDYNVMFSSSAFDSVQNSEYVENCITSSNLFGCVSLKKNNYAILNKIYTKEEYFKLKNKIIEHMNTMPYRDKKGIVYKYSEFPPIEISPFAYNETLAQDFFPLSKEEIIKNGYKYKEITKKDYQSTVKSQMIPDDIKEANDDLINEIFQCNHLNKCNNHKCTGAFRLTNDEINFYKKHNIPIPNICPNCRYYERFEKLLPLKLWHRKCMNNGCENEFDTSYAPERPEIVYCESCYNKAVY